MKIWGWDWQNWWRQTRAQAWVRNISSGLYLLSLTLTLLFGAFYLHWPKSSKKQPTHQRVPESVTRQRRLLLQTADKIIRYQHYYREIFGRYAGDIQSLGIPKNLVGGTTDAVFHHYEVFIELQQGRRFFVRARARPTLHPNSVQSKDIFRIDQDFMIHSNFPEPQLTRKFLVQAAGRVLRLREREKEVIVGVAEKYWTFSKEKLGGSASVWTASGIRGRVRGTQLGNQQSGVASIDTIDTSDAAVGSRSPSAVTRTKIGLNEIYRFLGLGRYAQHVYFRELGYYAITWDDLDAHVGFRLMELGKSYSNISLEPIELSRNDYRLQVRGTAGNILGEVFSMDKFGNIEQIRFTDVIVERLRATTKFLSNPGRFQISEIPDEKSLIIKQDRRQKLDSSP